MAGFREFLTGEVLTAANVDDFLMKQSVQKYADAAARDAALGTAVAGGNALREGMVAYLDDTDEVIKYDGSSWSSVAPLQNLVQTQYVIKTDIFTVSLAAAPTISGAVTGLSASITPTDANNDLIVFALVSGGRTEAAGNSMVHLFRDGAPTALRGDADGSRQRISALFTNGAVGVQQKTLVHRVAAGSTSSTTFDIRMSHGSASTETVYVNRERSTGDTNSAAFGRGVSSILVMEVRV